MSSTPSFAPERFHRHVFVWFAPDAHDASASPEKFAILSDWLAEKRPLIIRRRTESDPPDLLPLGLALPGKRRLAFALPHADVRDVAPPPVIPTTGEIFDRLAAAARDAGAELRAFGSHAWQFLTGLSYVTPESDIDLLVFLEERSSWERLRAALAEIPLPPKIDLEIVLRRDASFSWREFSSADERLLFKGETRAWLGAKTDVAALL
jgi:phosphoribosyl-dephospho-CoA transferase